MAALASKPSHPAPHNLANYRSQNNLTASYGTSFASPTDSEFSTGYDDSDSVKSWDSDRVADWLRSINAGQYIEVFLANDIDGSNLMDLDQTVLKEMGVKKVGDRVRIGAQVKQFRYQEYSRKRRSARDSYILPDNVIHTPPSSGSPRPLRDATSNARSENRANSQTRYGHAGTGRITSRSNSPLPPEPEHRSSKPSRLAAVSPKDFSTEQTGTHVHRRNVDSPRTAGFDNPGRPRAGTAETPKTARFQPTNGKSLSIDTTTANGALPADPRTIQVIFDNARAATFSVEGCKSSEEVILKTLRKGMLNESHVKSYCFWILDGTEPNAKYCRRLHEPELLRICNDHTRKERDRLMFRKIHAGEPEGSQLKTAANAARSEKKLIQLTGGPLPSLSYPMSPSSREERERHLSEAQDGLEGGPRPAPRPRPRRARELQGARPPSELVVADPKTYFPDVDEDKIDNLRRMSVRRSQRLSRAQSRLSTASNFSMASSLDEAPPLPNIAESAWFNNNGPSGRRPLSIVRMGRPVSTYRESFASSILDPLDEESPVEPNRASYVSVSEDETGSAAVDVTDPEGHTIRKSYFGEGSSPSATESGSSLNEQLIRAISEDGEEKDDELVNHLKPEALDDIQYIRGKLIGQGSFGSVYLALHAFTAELMAVKQVELPSIEGTPVDTKKNNMIEALKREIALLRELKHPHIVSYLGSSSDINNLNIFLEYVPGGSIAKMLVDYGSLNENLVVTFVRQILVGLSYLHSKDIIHRDIKGANILVDNHGKVKISDFGISKRVQDSKKTLLGGSGNGSQKGRNFAANRVSLQGSVFWMAPEVVRQTAYTRKADIWSLGCLVVEMLTGSHPHPNLSQLQAIFKIGGKGTGGAPNDPSPEVPAQSSKDAKDFLKKTFSMDHEQRPEAEELLQASFLKMKN